MSSSAISEINKVWLQKFPGSSLPEAWAEDVKTNLSKHKKRVKELEDELEQEKVYVQFLESLLAEVSTTNQSTNENKSSQESSVQSKASIQEMDDVIKDTLERRSIAAASLSINEEAEEEEKDHFVTVIEVNGFKKGGGGSGSGGNSQERQKKVPPRPPPKVFKRQCSEPTSDTSTNLKGTGNECNEDRPVIFDSRKHSLDESSSSSSSDHLKFHLKRFEGSKCPLPEEKVQRSNGEGRSKILELVNKMESNNSKGKVDAISPIRRSFKKEPIISDDYVDPCDADFEQNPTNSSDQIYDSPPPEDEDYFPPAAAASTPPKSNSPVQSATEIQNEPMYDTVAPDQDDDYVLLLEEENSNKKEAESATIKSQSSVVSGHSINTTTSSGTTSETEGNSNSSANYVNIDYFLSKPGRFDSTDSIESEDEEDISLSSNTNDTNIDFDSGVGMFGCLDTLTAADNEKLIRFRYLLSNIADSENSYVEVLNVLLQYMKALKATLSTSKPVLSQDEFNIIFYKIPELYELHLKFLNGLKDKHHSTVGRHFQSLAHDIWVYGAFLQNYSRAVDTVRKCCSNNAEFCEIAKNIRLKSLTPGGQSQGISLETLLYTPVARVQKNTEIIQDLLKSLPDGHPDELNLKSALREFQSFLSEFKMIQPEQLFQGQDRSPRHLVKNSFIVELSEGHRKLRHIFLFNDVFVCAKYKPTGKSEKYTFELKWYIPVTDCTVLEENFEPKESTTVNLVALRSQASTVRDQIKRQTSRDDPKKAKAEKQRKKLAELEAQLVLVSPNLVFKIKSGNGRSYTFFLSSEYERSQWIDAIDALKTSQPSNTGQLSMSEMQNWLTSCRKHLKTNMGSYLLRSGRDENLLVGDLYILIQELKGIQRPADLYICLEVDSYGHFFRKAKTKMICESTCPNWNQDFTIELEGAQNIRILLYEDHQRQGTLIRAKTTIELNKSWCGGTLNERKIDLGDYTLGLFTKFTPSEMTIRRVPTAKPSGLFGAKITQVCKREKRQIPFILTSCLREVERRGINEVGIYRVSGSTSDVSRLKKAFETNCYEAEQLLKEVDIHSVTGLLKLYMRELPEALFTDELYPRFFDAFSTKDSETKIRNLLQLFSTLPPINQHIILSLLDHMVRINEHESHNKMSLHNIATVFGPTLLRPGAKPDACVGGDLLAAGTVDVMAQSGILYFFLTRRANDEPMQISNNH